MKTEREVKYLVRHPESLFCVIGPGEQHGAGDLCLRHSGYLGAQKSLKNHMHLANTQHP
jgi:hypothetical protein